jgi:hypothetical protein
LICRNLSEYFDKELTLENRSNPGNIVHCHNPLWMPPNKDFVCVLSKRKDLFSLIMSILIGRRSDEFSDYSNKDIQPFEISEIEFTGCFWFVKCFYHAIDIGQFKKVIEIYYEDLITEPEHLFSKFNIVGSTDYDLSKKTPYQYHDLVLNLAELAAMFQRLDQQPVTNELVDSLKKSIAADLDQIYNKESLTLRA